MNILIWSSASTQTLLNLTEAILLLGSNLDNPEHQLKLALDWVTTQAGELLKSSSVYWTEPWGNTSQPPFLNQVLQIKTSLSSDELLQVLLSIEQQMGRQRIVKWGSRTIDIDILYYGDEIVVKPELKIPHPEIANRRFVLVPLDEIAPTFKHPVLNIDSRELLRRCQDLLEVKKIVDC